MLMEKKLDDHAHYAALVAESTRRADLVAEAARDDDEARWYLLNVVSGREGAASDHLKRFNFDVYYPMTQVLLRVPRKELSRKQRAAGMLIQKPKLKPLFKGYMFARFNIKIGAWQEVFRMRGIRGTFWSSEQPEHVPDEVIASIKGCEVAGVVPGSMAIEDVLGVKIGDQVVVDEGPLAYFSGTVSRLPTGFTPGATVEQLDESARCEILVSIFGRATPVQLRPGQFSKLQD